jgi:signal peptide peptidase SppA
MLSPIYCVACRPWAIAADLAAHVHGMLLKEGTPALRHLAAVKSIVHSREIENSRSAPKRDTAMVAVVQAVGTLTRQAHVINSELTRSTAEIAHEVTTFAAEPHVEGIVLELDTPGGEVLGMPEAFVAIRAAARQKPVIAYANSIAASGGYYLGAAADEFFVNPSGRVGSIGVFALHVDRSRWLDSEVEKWTFLAAGHDGTAASPTPLPSDEESASLQIEVDRYYDMFVHDVARRREVSLEKVRTGFGGGRMLTAKAALGKRMVDAIGSLDEAIARAAQLGRARRESSGSRASSVAPRGSL